MVASSGTGCPTGWNAPLLVDAVSDESFDPVSYRIQPIGDELRGRPHRLGLSVALGLASQRHVFLCTLEVRLDRRDIDSLRESPIAFPQMR
jgi:hypothetical protein